MTKIETATLRIVDPHIHLWDLGTGLYPRRVARGPGKSSMTGDYLLDDLITDAGPIKILKAVHVEASATDGLAEARHMQAMADAAATGIPQAIVARADLADPQADATLARLAAIPNVRGIRQMLYRYSEPLPNDYLRYPAWRTGFGLLRRHGLSFDLQASPRQMAEVARLACDHPDIGIVLNHIGNIADRSLDMWRTWREGLRLLAKCENVWIKISGLAMFDAQWTIESLRPYVFEALDAFGPHRAMFASNFPVDKSGSSYPALWQAFAVIVEALPPDDQARLLRGNAERFYRI